MIKKLLLQKLDNPYLGHAKNRIAMAAMTRSFADVDHKATSRMLEYYERRAADGVALILTEGVVIHHSADGYKDVPRLETDAQAESWRPVVAAVQKHGTRIFCQLWHCGRISHSDFTDGVAPLSSTNEPATGINRQNGKPFGTPKALTREGIQQVHEQYLAAADRALKVGFDGVQLHLGHGYLADQFFDSRINTRTDEYGGSVENRCRFAVELIEKFMARYDAKKVMVRISPSRDMGGTYDWPDLDKMLNYFIPAMSKLGVRMLDISCARADYYQTSGRIIRIVRPMWPGFLMGGASLTAAQAEAELESGLVDMVTWGRALIANPDLVSRIQSGEAWREFDPKMLGELF